MSTTVAPPQEGVESPTELSAKQVRELRRLCRKTANRAEYDDRSVQVRQIASILAMGTPSLRLFAPGYWAAGSALQAWVDRVREDGADWRDERILLPDAVEELRDWDRLLKIWAKRRFACSADDENDDSAAVKTPSRNSSTPRTPLRDIRNTVVTGAQQSQHRASGKWNASPVSVSTDVETPVADRLRRTKSGLPRRDSTRTFGTPITPSVELPARSPELITPRPRLVPAPRIAASSPVVPYGEDSSDSDCGILERRPPNVEGLASSEYDGVVSSQSIARVGASRAPLSSLSISRDGNVINVDIPKRSGIVSMARSAGPVVEDENTAPQTQIASKSNKSLKNVGDDLRTEKVRDWSSLRASTRGRRPVLTAARHDYANMQSPPADRAPVVGGHDTTA